MGSARGAEEADAGLASEVTAFPFRSRLGARRWMGPLPPVRPPSPTGWSRTQRLAQRRFKWLGSVRINGVQTCIAQLGPVGPGEHGLQAGAQLTMLCGIMPLPTPACILLLLLFSYRLYIIVGSSHIIKISDILTEC